MIHKYENASLKNAKICRTTEEKIRENIQRSNPDENDDVHDHISH